MHGRLYRNSRIFVADSLIHGRGVFTDTIILPGEIVEKAPVVFPKERSRKLALDSEYLNYFFSWPGLQEDWKKALDETGYLNLDQITYPVCVLGYAMMYNHSNTPNVVFEPIVEERIFEFRALRRILDGEELTICYREGLEFS